MDCPNCITPWKCNSPHLEKITEHLYSSIEGYYMFNKDSNEWTFIPHEKPFLNNQLLDIINTLNTLNKEVNRHPLSS